MIYVYRCPRCDDVRELMRPVQDRNEPVYCECIRTQSLVFDEADPLALVTMEREVGSPAVHFVGLGWTRTPAIMKDPIAKDNPGAHTNWGTTSPANYGGSDDGSDE